MVRWVLKILEQGPSQTAGNSTTSLTIDQEPIISLEEVASPNNIPTHTLRVMVDQHCTAQVLLSVPELVSSSMLDKALHSVTQS